MTAQKINTTEKGLWMISLDNAVVVAVSIFQSVLTTRALHSFILAYQPHRKNRDMLL